MNISFFGATSKTGRFIVPLLCQSEHAVRVIGRDSSRLDVLDPHAERFVADLNEEDSVIAALDGTDCVVSLAHARFLPAILRAAPQTCRHWVVTGSTRAFSALPDSAAEEVRFSEQAFKNSGRAGVMLHPTMIYGAPDDRNINRVLRLIDRWPGWLPIVVPLPAGGRARLQPVFVDDMVNAVVAAVERPEAAGDPIIVAGAKALSYADMVRACAKARGRCVKILGLPLSLLGLAARLGAPFNAEELRRAAEDKVFDITPMVERLGIVPRPFEEGLRLKIERGWFVGS